MCSSDLEMLAAEGDTAKRFRDELQLWSYDGLPQLDQLMASTKAALQDLRDAVAARGDRLLVAVAPPAYYVDAQMMKQLLTEFGVSGEGTDSPRERVLSTLTELGVASCDLTPGLREAIDQGRRPYLRFDGHWNAVGHRVAAEEIARCWRKADFESKRAASVVP